MRRTIYKIICVLFISISAFMALDPIPVTLYLFLLDIIILAEMLLFFNRHNIEFLLCSIALEMANEFAYVLTRILSGNVSSLRLYGRGWIFDASFMILLMLYTVKILGTIFFYITNKNYKAVASDKRKNDFIYQSGDVSNDFIEARKYDLNRLSEYISFENVVGINGAWGTGKTKLSEEFCRINENKICCIRVEALTCNEDEMDVFLIKELETLLNEKHIYSQNSRKLKQLLSAQGFLNDIRMAIWDDCTVKTEILKNYKEDLKKLDKTVLIVVEDLDRMKNDGAIRRILEFTANLSDTHIKIIYEYDAQQMKKMGFDRNYLEKYIPFVVNLTPISFENIINYLEMQNYVDASDYLFLTKNVYPESIVEKELGFNGLVNVELKNPSIRIVKSFVEETQKFSTLYAFDDENNKKTMIAFFFMKHFLDYIYEELVFRYDFLEEIKFVSERTGNRYTIQELINEARKDNNGTDITSGLTKDDIRELFQNNNKYKEETEIQNANRARYYLLCILGYSFQDMDENNQRKKMKYNSNTDKAKAEYEYLFQLDINKVERLYRNEKISRIIRNLHANGLSENTNDEAMASMFIKEVLFSADMKEAWNRFFKSLVKGKLSKDNSYSFNLLVEYDVYFARTLSIYLSNSQHIVDAKEIWKKLLEFRYAGCKHLFSENINPEYISFCYYIDIHEREIYLFQIRAFNKMQVIGNLNKEKMYREFLKKYIDNGYALGFLNEPSDFHLDYVIRDEVHIESAVEYLENISKRVEKFMESNIYKDIALSDLHDVYEFLYKNIEIFKQDKAVREKELGIQISERSISHNPDGDSDELFRRITNGDTMDDRTFLYALNEEYKKGNITIRGMERLKRMYDDGRQYN